MHNNPASYEGYLKTEKKKQQQQLIGRVDTAYIKDGWVGEGKTDKPIIVAYFAPEFSDTIEN